MDGENGPGDGGSDGIHVTGEATGWGQKLKVIASGRPAAYVLLCVGTYYGLVSSEIDFPGAVIAGILSVAGLGYMLGSQAAESQIQRLEREVGRQRDEIDRISKERNELQSIANRGSSNDQGQ